MFSDDAFIVKEVGQHRKRRNGEAPRDVRGRGPTQSHGKGRQETWEVLPEPAGGTAGYGESRRTKTSGPAPGLQGVGSATASHEQVSNLRTRLTNQ